MRKRPAKVIGREGGLKTASLLSLVLAFASVAFIFAAGRDASAAAAVMIGVDMSPSESGGSHVATCAAVQPGDSFDADIFITNAESLVQWELRVDFDPDVVLLESADYAYFLTQSGGGLTFPLFEVEKPGRRFLSATEQHHPDSGSGVLARLHLRAVGEGSSALTIASSPTVYGPRLLAAPGVPFGDTNGDGTFDGSLTSARVDVGQACSPSTPVVTPSPKPATATPRLGERTPTPRPKPGAKTPTPTAVAGGGSDDTPKPGDDQSTPVPSEFVINPPGGSDAGNNDTPGDEPSNEGVDSENNGSADPDKNDEGEGGSGDGIDRGQLNDSDGGSSSLILILAGAFAVVAVLIGAAFLSLQAYWRR